MFPRALFLTPVLLVAQALAQLPSVEPPRSWTTAEGKSFQAAVVSFDGTTAIFRMPDGSRAQAPVAKLSPQSAQDLADWLDRQPIKFTLPDTVGVEPSQIKAEIVSEDAANERYVYRTTHFEFDSQAKFSQALLRDVGRNFEATYELIKALPWGVEPKPESGDFFRAKLFLNHVGYTNAGGLPNSGGCYLPNKEMFLVPFDSIGLKVVGKSYAKDDNFDTHTLVHELTHQMMHSWLNSLPQWVVEGTAEYTGILPLRAGKFRLAAAKSGLKDYITFLRTRTEHGVPEPYPLEKLFTITNEEWNNTMAEDTQSAHRLYFTSYLLVYYFMHLDGKGDGQRFVRFFRKVGEARKEVDAYRKAMAEFKKLPGVEVTPDGGLRYPSNLKRPERPKVLQSAEARTEFQTKMLGILLDGRSEADLMKQIRSAYVRLGVRL